MKNIPFAAFLFLPVAAFAQPACTPQAPGAPACQSQAVTPQATDIVFGQQATGPQRQNQTVKFSLSQLMLNQYLPLSGGVLTGALLVQGAVNTTGSTGYQVDGSPLLNLLSNQISPILSPETANIPSPDASYMPRPMVMGYAETAGASTYASMTTDNLTISGTVTNHWGEAEDTINLVGTGTMNGELNNRKAYVVVPFGLTLGTGENFEAMILNNGTLTSWNGYTAAVRNGSTGTVATATAINIGPVNDNTTANSFGTWIGINCLPKSGGGSALGVLQCIFNQDEGSEITNAGHYGARPGSAAPTLSGCGGGTPSLDGRAGDVMGTITEGTTATGCTLTFHIPYQFSAPHCVLSSPNGATFTGLTLSTTSLVITNSSASGNQYTYLCMAGF